MLFNQAKDRFGNKSRWIAGISLLAVVGAVCISARPAKSHFTAPSAPTAEKGSPLNAQLSTQAASPDEQARIASSFGNLPLSFEPNLGQTDPEVKFLSRNPHYNLFLTSDEAVFTLPIAPREKAQRVPRREKPHPTSQAVLRMKMLGSNATPEVAGDTKIAGHSNYLIGRDASKWVRDVEQYARINYRGVYPGIDLTFYGQQRQLEFDFIVKPNADAKNIALGIEGAKKMATDASGDLVLTSAAGDLRLHKPVAYQLQGDTRQPVDASFVIKGTEVAFAVGNYDHTRDLVIDPSFLYATYLGAGNDDDGYAIAVDSAGAAYVTGQSSSPSFPKANPLPAPNNNLQGTTDAFVTKFSADGKTLVYSTYLGGTGTDSANAIALDSSLQVCVTGSTDSTDFPGTGNPQPTLVGGTDAFVAELSAAGNSIVYATYIGGTNDDIGYGVAVDSTGIYVVGSTSSNDFGPIANANLQGSFAGGTGTTPTDGFVVKLNPATGNALFGDYLGGTGNDIATGVAVDAAHVIYVAGVTLSTDFPARGAAANYPNSLQCGTDGTCNGGKDDSFVSAIAFAGVVPSFVYSHYLGGSSFDDANQIVVDSTSNAYVVGITSSSDFPTTSGAFQRTLASGASNAYVAKLNATGTILTFSTYVGGSGTDNALNVALDGSNNVYITGSTTSTNFPTTASAPQKTLGGNKDAFVTELKSTGAGPLVFSTYLGGSQEEDHFLAGIAVDSSNNVYVTGDTLSPDFPVTGNPFQASIVKNCGTCRDAFVVKISPLDPGFTVAVGAITPAAISKGSTGTSTVTVTSTTAAGTVALACNITTSAAKPPTCSVSPNSVALTAGGTQTSTLTITTTATGSTSIVTTGMWLPLPGLTLLGAGFLRDKNRKRKVLVAVASCLALAGLLTMVACGSGNGGGGGGGGGGGTTAGSYSVTVTGSITNKGSANGSANFSVQ